MRDLDLDELERLHAAATPGPWKHGGGSLGSMATNANSALIAAMHSALPALIATARERDAMDVACVECGKPAACIGDYSNEPGKDVYQVKPWHLLTHEERNYCVLDGLRYASVRPRTPGGPEIGHILKAAIVALEAAAPYPDEALLVAFGTDEVLEIVDVVFLSSVAVSLLSLSGPRELYQVDIAYLRPLTPGAAAFLEGLR